MERRLSKGESRYISQGLIPEARRSASSDQAWVAVEKILEAKVDSYPEKYSKYIGAIMFYNSLRWRMYHDHINGREGINLIGQFSREYDDQTLDEMAPVMRVISKIFSR